MKSPTTLWKATAGVVLYVMTCIAILCFSGPDYAAIAGTHAQCADQTLKSPGERAIGKALKLH
jgi:hypothetical protein